MFELIRPNTKFNFLGRRKQFYVFSLFLIGASLLSLAVRTATNGSPLNYGIDFTGGTEIQLSFKQEVPADQVRSTMGKLGFDAEVQSVDTGGKTHDYLVRIRQQVTVIDGKLAKQLEAALTERQAVLGKTTLFDPAASGDKVYLRFDKEPDQGAIKEAFTKLGLDVTRIDRTGRPQDFSFTVQLEELQTKIAAMFQSQFTDRFGSVARVQLVGPKAGEQLRNDGLLSLLIALLLIAIYVGVRFDFRYATGALLSLFHDPLIVLGCFSIFWWEFSLNGVAALLTILGYSINDTIVIFDRIRELVGPSHDKDLVRTANQALNETLSRTILTSSLTMMAVVAILIFGGSLLREFAVALTIGLVIGVYSTIGVASSIMIDMDRIMPKIVALFGPKKVATAPRTPGKPA